MTRGGRLAVRVASVLAPGLAQAARGRLALAAVFASLATLCIAGGALGAAMVACTCPVVTATVLFALVALAALAHDLRDARPERSRATPLFTSGRPMAAASLVAALPFVALALTRAVLVDLFVVPTDSMSPTLRPGDTIFVSRITAPERGAVTVFADEHERLYVKRIAAVAGDRVEIRQGELWLNGEPAPLLLDAHPDDALIGRYYTRTGGRGHRVLFRLPYLTRPSLAARVVPRGHVFMLGDNRDHSEDSRSYGFVPENALIGRAFALGPRHGDDGLDWRHLGFLL